MFKRLTLIATMIALTSTMAFAQASSDTSTKKTLHKQAKHVSAKPAKKHVTTASKKTKKTKKIA